MFHGISSAGSAAFEAAVAAVSKYGGASAGHRTLLDALFPASATLREVYSCFLKKRLFSLPSVVAGDILLSITSQMHGNVTLLWRQ